jgi:RND family efflux transporter MFP subunit
MNKGQFFAGIAVLSLLIGLAARAAYSQQSQEASKITHSKPTLSVNIVQPLLRQMPVQLSANGSLAAWQEAIISAEVSDLHLSEVRVQVGEKVNKGQILAVFADETVQTDIEQSRATVAEAEANLAIAHLNVQRAEEIADSGAISRQQIDQYRTSVKTANAKLQLAKAQLDGQLLRLKYTKVVASDEGTISSRTATLGAVTGKGQELFRLIRQNRLEWRAEVTAAEIAQLKPGIPVTVSVPNVGIVNGTVRYLSPTLDVQSRNGLVYVDLPLAANKGFRAGMYARGEFNLGTVSGLSIPQEALSLREGFSYVFKLGEQNGDLAKVTQVKVELGRREENQQEILAGISNTDRLVASGATFLTDGDTVRVVQP